MANTFRELIVWQKSIRLAKEVYQITEALPSEENYGLKSQMRRAAIAIPSNIAEGAKRRTTKDFLQFLHIADGSAAELETQLILAEELYPRVKSSHTAALLDEVEKMLGSMMRKLAGSRISSH